MKKLSYRHPVSVAAHRGDQAKYAENTREAFAAAIACGCDMIETDIHMTRDNVLILMHDHAVDRTTDGTGLIRTSARPPAQEKMIVPRTSPR